MIHHPDDHQESQPSPEVGDQQAEPSYDVSSPADDASTDPAADGPRPTEATPGSAHVPTDGSAAPDVPEEDPAAVDIEALADSDPRTKAELLAELLAAEAKRDEYLDDLRRSHADFENYRRRVMRDGAVQRASGKGDVAGALLEVLDDLDRTVHAAEGSPDDDLATGIRLVASKLLDALRQQGLERVAAVDVPFDPNVHEAVQQQPGEGLDGEPKVVAVLRPGYRMDDRVLRAAMVAVEN